jgi:hypothetical protein
VGRLSVLLVAIAVCQPVATAAPEEPASVESLKREDILPEQLQIWLDFKGGDSLELTNCADVRFAQTCIAGSDGAYVAFSGDWKFQDDIRKELERVFAPFDVRVTQYRPTIGPIIHVVFTGRPAYFVKYPEKVGKTLGFGYVDCANYNLWDTVFVLDDFTADDAGTLRFAQTSAHEVGHALGFEHSSAVRHHALNPRVSVGSTFLDACLKIDDDSKCPDEDRAWRCAPGQRNYYRELMAIAGPNPRRETADADETTQQ